MNPTDSEAETPGTRSAGEAVPGNWPGLRPFEFGEWKRLGGRKSEVEKLARQFQRTKSGQSPVIWLHGDAGAGKTSLAQAGLFPRLARRQGDGFDWFKVEPSPEKPADGLIYEIASQVFGRAPDTDETAIDLDSRLRQFALILKQDSVEAAAEYLASCYRQSVFDDGSGGARTACVVFVDHLERAPEFEALIREGASGLAGKLDLLLSFVQQLSLTGLFPVVIGLRGIWVAEVKAALAQAGFPTLGSWVAVPGIEPGAVRGFFESAPSELAESGEIRVAPELVDSLIENAGDRPVRLPWISETLRRLTENDPETESLSTEDARWFGGMERACADAAERAVAAVGAGEGLDETAFDSLMAALYADPSSDSVRAMGFLDLLGDPAVGRWVRLLIDARFLALNGHSLDQARVSWVFPKALSHWAEAKRWIERHDRLLARAAEFERARQRWEEEERSPVCLLLATRAVDDARDLLDYHIRRPFLTDPLIEYLRESIAIEGRLVEEIRKIAWIKRGAVAAGVVLLGLLAWVVF